MTSSRFALLIALLLASPAAWSSLTVNVTGVVVEGVCEINNGETVHVDFGSNLQARQLDGENLRPPSGHRPRRAGGQIVYERRIDAAKDLDAVYLAGGACFAGRADKR